MTICGREFRLYMTGNSVFIDRLRWLSAHVEVCVKKDDTAAIHLYEKNGFVDSGYIDEDAPDSLNMICHLI